MIVLLSLIVLSGCGDDVTDTDTDTDTGTVVTTDDSGTGITGNVPPTCAITSPPDGTFGEEGTTITFIASVGDEDQTPSSLTVSWESDKDGDLGSSTPNSDGEVVLVTDELRVDTHVVSVFVTDSAGEVCSDFVLYTVGEPPTAVITAPASGVTFGEGESITFTGRVQDTSTDAAELVIRWSSDRDGVLDSSGASTDGDVGFLTGALSAGPHQVELSATDEDGLYAVDSIDLLIDGVPSVPTVSLSPADPDTTDDLVVSVDAPSVDPEGDAVTYDYAWSLFSTPSAESTDARLPATATTRGDVWAVAVTATDGVGVSDAGEASVTVGNALPSLTGATISPDPAGAEDTLTCASTGWFDADDDTEASTYAWSIDGSAVGTGPTLSGAFGGDDQVTCEVTPHDGLDAGDPVTAVVTIGNSAPSIVVVSISPDPATVADTLTCSWSGYADPDGDSDASYASWSVDGSPAGSGTTLSTGFAGGDVVTCTVTPFDGASTGTPVDASLTVTNTAPSLDAASITPDPAIASDTLVCTASGWDDADGDADQSTWAWTLNGSSVGSATTLSGGFVAGDLVVCTVTPDDGSDTGTPVSDSLTISNSAPSVSDVVIDPDPAVAGDVLSCSWTWSDADGDADASTVAWTVNGGAVGSDPTLDTSLVRGDRVACTVTPDDGTDTGTAVTASLVVDNTAPSLASATITPNPAGVGDTLTCSWSGWSDADGDSDQSIVLWTVGGVATSTATTLSSGFGGGDTVTCEVTPYDGVDAGDVVSDTVEIDNTPPVIADASITPDPARVDDTLTCLPGSVTDADGATSFTYTYAWQVDGVDAGSDSTLAGAFSKGEGVTCSVTPSDGADEGNTVTSPALTISNTAPEVLTVTFSPSAPTTDDTLSVSVSTDDADGDSVALTYSWSVDGSGLGETGATLDGATWFDKGETVEVEVVPGDGDEDGDAYIAGVTVANSPPGAPTVSITPESPREGLDDLVCGVDSDSDDADGDAVSYTATWDADGVSYSGATTTTWTGDTVPAGDAYEGEVWTCTVTPDDGDDAGTTGEASVTVGASGSTVTFDGTYGTSWETLASGTGSHLYSMMTFHPADMAYLYMTYASPMEYYDPATDSWGAVSSSTPYVSPWNTTAPWDGDLWMIRDNTVYRYDIDTDTWTSEASYSGSDDLNMTESDESGHIYGYSGSGEIIDYDTTDGSVSYLGTGKGSQYETRLAYDPDPRAIYFGSYSSSALYRYGLDSGSVDTMTSHPESQLNDIYCGDRSGHIYAAGNSSGTTMWQYDIATDAWSAMPDLPTDHGNNGSCTVSEDGWLYVATGSNLVLHRIALY